MSWIENTAIATAANNGMRVMAPAHCNTRPDVRSLTVLSVWMCTTFPQCQCRVEKPPGSEQRRLGRGADCRAFEDDGEKRSSRNQNQRHTDRQPSCPWEVAGPLVNGWTELCCLHGDHSHNPTFPISTLQGVS